MSSRIPETLPPVDVASPELIAQVRAIVERYGQMGACRVLGVSRETMMTLCAGMRCRPGSIALVAQRAALVQLDAAEGT